MAGSVADDDVPCGISKLICRKICDIFQVKDLRSYQLLTLQYILQGEDCFVCQPTGSGKSLIFQALPFLSYFCSQRKEFLEASTSTELCNVCSKSVLVVSPLISLMDDQVESLSKKGIRAIHLDAESDADLEEIQNGYFQIIFISPESLLDKYRYMLKKKRFVDTIVGVAIDESHCIKKWGSSNTNTEAFRCMYSRLSEIRSLMYKNVPFIALTATATTDTIDYIIDNLGLRNPIKIVEIPHKQNIKYNVISSPVKTPGFIFKPFIENIGTPSGNKRIIVFCRKVEDVSSVFNAFHSLLRKSYPESKTRPYAMYHARTQENIKNLIVKSFSDPDGVIRFLVATVAFGMGVDCKGVNDVIHFGPPSSLDDYFQESGRCGRNNEESNATIITYPQCLSTSKVDSNMKDYCKNKEICRRLLLLSIYTKEPNFVKEKHDCCDVCAKKCECTGNETCSSINKYPSYVDHILKYESEKIKVKVKVLTGEGEAELRNQLMAIHDKCVIEETSTLLNTSVTSGFPLQCIDEIVTNVSWDFDLDVLVDKTSLVSYAHADRIISLVQGILENEEYVLDDSEYCSSEFEESEEIVTSDSDVELLHKKYRFHQLESSDSD